MFPGRRALVLLGIVAIIGAVVFAASRGRKARAVPGLLAAVPADTWLVLRVDVAALRVSPVAQPLLGSLGATWPPGLGAVANACGFDPWARVREVVVAVPEGGESGDGGLAGEFGVAFSADWTKDELVACAMKAITARGRRPQTSNRGAFALIEDGEDPTRGRLAFREGGPYLVGRGPWLDAMMDAVAAGLPPPEAHRALFESLLATARSDGGPPPAIIVTALLPRALRDRLSRESAPYLPHDMSPNSVDPRRTDLLPMLGVDSVGLAVSAPGPGSTTSAHSETHCESPAACAAVKDLIERKKLGWSRNFAARLLGLGPLIDDLAVELDGAVVRVKTQAPSDDLGRAVRRVLELQGLSTRQAPPPLRQTP